MFLAIDGIRKPCVRSVFICSDPEPENIVRHLSYTFEALYDTYALIGSDARDSAGKRCTTLEQKSGYRGLGLIHKSTTDSGKGGLKSH